MKRCTPEQLATLKANYGKHDEACVATVKALYASLCLEDVFKAYEQARRRSAKGGGGRDNEGCADSRQVPAAAQPHTPVRSPTSSVARSHMSSVYTLQESYETLKRMITATCAKSGGVVPEEVYLSLLHKIYKRQK
jgi:hypothetical protein